MTDLICAVLVAVFYVLGFVVGRRHARKQIQKALPGLIQSATKKVLTTERLIALGLTAVQAQKLSQAESKNATHH